MSMFDNLLEDDDSQKVKAKPFHTVQDADDKKLLAWLNEVSSALMKINTTRNHALKSNLAAYRGINYRKAASKSTYNRQSESIPTNNTERFVVNHLYDMTETKVSQLTRLKPSIEVLPTNNEFEDKNSARATKMLIDHLWYINDIDGMLQCLHRSKKIFGEAFLAIEWDKDKGDKHPDAGMTLEDGSEVDPALKTGDVCFREVLPWRLLFQYQDKFTDVEYSFETKLEHIETLKKEHPKHKEKIKADNNVFEFDLSNLDNNRLEDTAVVFYFHHKSTKFTDKGRYIKFTKDVILEDGEGKYSHGQLPYLRITDLDIPDVMHGVSAYEMVKPIQNMHNNLSTLLTKNLYLMGHAKWVMPKGACKLDSLGNASTIVQYQGPIAPQMVQTTPNPPEAYAFRDKLVDEMNQIYAVHGISRGEPPAGITASVALNFLNEQESERSSTEISKASAYMKEIAKMTLAVAGDFYEPEDGRLLRILGKDNRYLIKHFDAADLSKSYDIRIQNGNALADSKAGQTQKIIEVLQYAPPGTLSSEQIVEYLDIGKADEVISAITVAVRAAESENEDILSGKGDEVGDPQEWEDSIIHWRVHVKKIQDRSFKEEVPLEYRQQLIEHITITEFQMTQKAQENPLFQSKLAQLDLFPIFYREGFQAQSAEQQIQQVQGQANRGEEVTGQIPAFDPQPLPGEPQRGDK